MITDELISNLIQLEGRYTWFNMSTHFCKGCTNKLVGLAHECDFIFCLQKYLHSKRPN